MMEWYYYMLIIGSSLIILILVYYLLRLAGMDIPMFQPVKKYYAKAKKPEEKSIDNMQMYELRYIAKQYNVKTGGKKKALVKKQVKAAIKASQPKMKNIGDIEKSVASNDEFGSIYTTKIEEDKYDIQIIERDANPRKKQITERMDEGMYGINSKTYLNQDESIIVLITPKDIPKENKKGD